ncbi:MAG: glycoside hydrolase family 3 N-terminal domain-containing protein [Gammaproteobacteria bacterium]
MPLDSPMRDVDALVAAMTLEEKIGQMTLTSTGLVITGPGEIGDYLSEIRAGRLGMLSNVHEATLAREIQRVAVNESRLGIPLVFAADVIHGFRTIFPIPLAEVATFDPELWRTTAHLAAQEASEGGLALTFAPMLDVTREPRWGRIAESPGEDAWLASRYAEAKVCGFQGSDLTRPGCLAATAKHLAAYGAVTAGREYASVDISEHTLHDVYLPPFRAAVAAGVSAIMPAFTDLAGVPMSANESVLRGIVRERWGFDGVMVSDHGAIGELKAHGIARDDAEAAALALNAGIDVDLMSGTYARGLPGALQSGRVQLREIDVAVRRILTLKARLGLFDDPYRTFDGGEPSTLDMPARRALALRVANRSIVLLQNRDALLPLSDALRRVAAIGPLADERGHMLGPWVIAGRPEEAISLFDGLKDGLAGCEIEYERGVPIDDCSTEGIAAAVEKARWADVAILCLGEGRHMSGEAASRARPGLPAHQAELARAVLDTGTPVVVVLTSGRQLLEPWLFERAGTVLATWFLGSEAGNALADVLSGRWNPSGRLPVSWPVDVGQIPIHFGRRPTGRPPDPQDVWTSKYLDVQVEPAFHFGHGLSYTRFTLSGLHVRPRELRPGETLCAEIDVTNDGTRAGEHTVFLFVRDVVAKLAQPRMSLRGVAKANLEPNERTTLHFELQTDALAYLGSDLETILEDGEFEIMVGPSANPESLLVTTIRLCSNDAPGPG